MAAADEVFVDVGVGRCALDAAHGGRLSDVVDLTDHREDRDVDVGERDELAVNREAARHHPVVRDELLEQLGDRGAAPCDPAFALQESALLFARQECFAVVELTQEVHARFGGLDRVHHLETGARQPTWNVDVAEHVVGHEFRGGRREVGRKAHRQCRESVHRRSECDDAGEVSRPTVTGGLVRPHAALRVAGQMDVLAGGLLDGVDCLADRDDVIGQRALHAAFDAVGRPEVDDPRIDIRRVQDADGAVFAGDVPHVRRHHHRMHHQHRRSDRCLTVAVVGREVPPQPVHRSALDDLERRRHAAGFQAAVPDHFEPVLRGGDQASDRRRDW